MTDMATGRSLQKVETCASASVHSDVISTSVKAYRCGKENAVVEEMILDECYCPLPKARTYSPLGSFSIY